MKKYEKIGVAIGAGALGLAAYQAWKAKQGVDSVMSLDPSRSPITGALEKTKSMVGGTFSWFRQRFDDVTGRVKGRTENIVNTMKAVPEGYSYWLEKSKDVGFKVGEAGGRYIRDFQERTKTGIKRLTNKGFTRMGSVATHFDLSRHVPKAAISIGDLMSRVDKVRKTTTDKTKHYFGYIGDFKNRVMRAI